ncbi:MAG: glycosyltransferase family 4 protein [Elusimicrobia bacterium]|nr:glycosyltransferase family 4 protein [Elusimicrobiota bacterium]
MKVALLIEDSGFSGHTYSVIAAHLIPRLRRSGHEVVLFRSRRDPRHPSKSLLRGCVCYTLGRRSAFYHRPLAAFQMFWAFRKERVDVAHLHFHGMDFWGFFLLRLFVPVPYVLTFHSYPAGLVQRRGREFWILNFLMKKASRITVVSRFLEESLRNAYPEALAKVRVIPNGAGRAFQAGPQAPGPLPGRFVLSVGVLCFEKGLDLLLLAFHDLLRDTGEDLRLVLCGEGLQEIFQDLIRRLGLESRVLLWGSCPYEAVLSLMGTCLFYVSASRSESFGMAILEAMAAGRAVVAPRVGGVFEFVRHEENGLLFDPGDAAGLKASMERLLRDASLRDCLGAEASRTALGFDWSEISRAYEQVQAEALQESIGSK